MGPFGTLLSGLGQERLRIFEREPLRPQCKQILSIIVVRYIEISFLEPGSHD